jgi:hypothetical protein
MYHIKYSCVLTTTYIILLVLNKHNGDDLPQKLSHRFLIHEIKWRQFYFHFTSYQRDIINIKFRCVPYEVTFNAVTLIPNLLKINFGVVEMKHAGEQT